MKLLEYQAKERFIHYGLPVQRGVVLSDQADAAQRIEAAGLRFPLVLKAQVPVGGRGKAGGIRFAETPEQAGAIADDLLFSDLKGHRVRHLLAAEKMEIRDEWYLAILLDRSARAPCIIFSAAGGVDIEETARNIPQAIVRATVNPLTGITDYVLRYLCSKSGVGLSYMETLGPILERLYALFLGDCCLLAEINPLAIGPDGAIIAVDGKVEVDDSALHRLPKAEEYRAALPEHPLVREARSFGFLYIPVSPGGRVATMSNGSGMLMSMIDLLSARGVAVGCALDLGGGATRERIREAVRILLSDRLVDTLFISIFGGITRCDEVAGGVRDALEAAEGEKTVIIRLEGTNKAAGVEIVAGLAGAVIVPGIAEGVAAIAEGGAL